MILLERYLHVCASLQYAIFHQRLQVWEAGPLPALVEYEVLAVLEFNSTRKRQSSIVRQPDGTIVLYCKVRQAGRRVLHSVTGMIDGAVRALTAEVCISMHRAAVVGRRGRGGRAPLTGVLNPGTGPPWYKFIIRDGEPFCSRRQGADTVIFERLGADGRKHCDDTMAHLEEYGNQGLRTLCLAYRYKRSHF